MIKKILLTVFIFIIYSYNLYAAGSSSDGGNSSKTKTNYEKAVAHIKLAKKYEKKGKTDKAKKKYQKAQKTGIDIIKKAMAQNKTERGETPDQDRKGFADRQARLSRVKDSPKELMRALIGEFPRTTDKYHLKND